MMVEHSAFVYYTRNPFSLDAGQETQISYYSPGNEAIRKTSVGFSDFFIVVFYVLNVALLESMCPSPRM